MNIDPGLKERMKALLGGKTVTKRRVEKLLEELEQARILTGEGDTAPATSGEPVEEARPSVAGPIESATELLAVRREVSPDGNGDDDEDDDISKPWDVPAKEPAAVAAPPQPPLFQDPAMQMMYDLLKSQQQET